MEGQGIYEDLFCGNCRTTYRKSFVRLNDGNCPGCSMSNFVETQSPIDAVNGRMEEYIERWQREGRE